MISRMSRMALMTVLLAAVTVSASAQETTGSAERGNRRPGAGMMPGRGMTTASLERAEQSWERIQRPLYEAAQIPAEKIEQLKALDMGAREALARGERPNLKALAEQRQQLLTPEEKQRIIEVQQERREKERARREAMTTGTPLQSEAGVTTGSL